MNNSLLKGHAPLSKKRSRLDLEVDEDVQVESPDGLLSPTLDLKRSRTHCDLEATEIVPAEDAWAVDVEGILSSPTFPTSPTAEREPHNNAERFRAGQSIIVICVQGNVQTHHDLLCAMLPELYAVAPSLQALVLCRDPATHIPSTRVPFSLPLIQAVHGNQNHFVKLGLLHPLGGGHFPLDALVVVDAKGRRRLVLPFGWGAGKHAATPAGRGVQTELMDKLRDCVQVLVRET